MPKTLTEMAQEIVVQQAGTRNMTVEEITHMLKETFAALQEVSRSEAQFLPKAEIPEEVKEIVQTDPLRSIQEHSITCLVCGQTFKQLSAKHLALHNLTPRDYRIRYGIPLRHPLSAKDVSEKRRETAIRLKLGQRMAAKRRQKQRASSGAEPAPAENPAAEGEQTTSRASSRGKTRAES